MKQVFLNGQFIEEEKATLHFRDLSFQRGYGIFDFFRLEGNKPLFLDDHLDRFFFSAQSMHLEISRDRPAIITAIEDLVRRNNLPNSGIRLSLTGGYSEDGFSLANPNFLISQHSFTPPTENQVQEGMRLLTYPHQRQLPAIKSIDYLMAVWLQPLRAKAGADDILYHQNNVISECPRSNFFLVTKDNKIITPANNILAGITRKKVLKLARQHFVVEEGPILLQDLLSAREAFITSTTKQILPVSLIDDIVLPHRDVAHSLLQRFRSVYGDQ